MIDTLLSFLSLSLTSDGTFSAFYSDGRTIKEDRNVFFNFVFLDAVLSFREKYPRIKFLSDKVLKFTLRYRPEGDMWRYWVNEEIYPDFKVAKSCVFLFKSNYDYEKKRCDCIVNINVFRFTKDTTLCPYIRKCWEKIEKLASYTYEHASYFFYYFYSKALSEGLSCGFDVKERIVGELKNDTLSGFPLILTFTSASILGIRGNDVDRAYQKIRANLLEDGGPKQEVYFYILGPRGPTKYRFFGRSFPAIILLEGILNYLNHDQGNY